MSSGTTLLTSWKIPSTMLHCTNGDAVSIRCLATTPGLQAVPVVGRPDRLQPVKVKVLVCIMPDPSDGFRVIW